MFPAGVKGLGCCCIFKALLPLTVFYQNSKTTTSKSQTPRHHHSQRHIVK
jgi:hypothetical protein